MNLAEARRFLDRRWDEQLVPRLVDYVKVPAKSPSFDASWAAHGHLQAVVKARSLGGAQRIAGMRLEIVTIDGRTPCLFFDVPATAGLGNERTVLFYGHLDKQPEMDGWREGLGPWQPVIEDGRLYGRGAADDGYAIFAALTVIAALDAQCGRRPRCVGIIETCEESGSPDLPAYLDLLAPRIGDVALVAGLDSGCGNYEQLWVTTSLRGLVGGTLTVEVLSEGVHSGNASGLVPSSFRIARQLLNRIDDAAGPRARRNFMRRSRPSGWRRRRPPARILGEQVWRQFPWSAAARRGRLRARHAYDHRAGRGDPQPHLAAGAVGHRRRRLPGIDSAGNVLRPKTTFKLSLRLPPTVDGQQATARLKRLLEHDPPYNARVSFDADWGATGWNAPATAPWLEQAPTRHRAPLRAGRGVDGRGRHDPVHEHARREVPRAQFLITGVLGPKSNAHGPNEFLHIDYAKKLSAAVASIVASVR